MMAFNVILGLILILIVTITFLFAVRALIRSAWILWTAASLVFIALGWATQGEWLGGQFTDFKFYHVFWIFVFVVPSIILYALRGGRTETAKAAGTAKSTETKAGPQAAEKGGKRFCPSCGAKVEAGKKFCKKCGAKQE